MPRVRVEQDAGLFQNVRDHLADDGKGLLDVWMSHGDKVVQLPPDFVVTASTAKNAPICGQYSMSLNPGLVCNSIRK